VVVQTASWVDRVTLPPLAANVGVARRFVQDLLIDHELLYLVDDIRLVTSELATNAARHAKTPFTVMLEGLIDSVRLTVSDDSLSGPVQAEMLSMASKGRGLTVVAGHSSDWGVTAGRRNAKSVWATFALRHRDVDESADRSPSTDIILMERGTVPRKSAPGWSARLLSERLRSLQEARFDVRAARASGHAQSVERAQGQLVASLTLYIDELGSRHLPVPYLLRDELRLYGGTCRIHSE
jgi:anti-sigma regulatory factor (Ser/Thr protein kinase)